MSNFPFLPKSTRDLRVGQFWGIPLEDGRFACGRVLQLGGDQLPTPTVSFFGGLMDWVGNVPPTGSSIAGTPVLKFGAMHLRAIKERGTGVLGELPLEPESTMVPTLLSSMGGVGCLVLLGAQSVRPAQASEWGKYPVLSSWGYDFINQLAARHFVGGN